MSQAIIGQDHGDAEVRGQALLRVVSEGGRGRKSASLLEREGQAMVGAIRRAVPFFSRRATPIVPQSVRTMSKAEIEAGMARPLHRVAIVAEPGLAAGWLFLDRTANAALLDGILGGDGKALPDLPEEGLSSAQTALVSRVAAGIVEGISQVLAARLGLTLKVRPGIAPAGGTEGSLVVATFEFETPAGPGTLHLALARDAVVDRRVSVEITPLAPQPRVVGTMQKVEVELVAELGRRRITLRELSHLKVGDTLRFDTRVDGLVRVHAAGSELFVGRPTAQNGQVAVRIERPPA